MSRRSSLRLVVAGSLSLLAAGVLWQGSLAQRGAQDDGKAAEQRQSDSTSTLGGEQRYLTHLSTDKPIYKPGEKMYLRAVVLHHATRQPLDEKAQGNAMIEITGPKGDVVAGGVQTTQDSVLGFSWEIPQAQAGGEYTIKVTHPWSGHAPAERKFDVRAYRAPRLKSQIKFLRDGYGPGDEVVATLHVERAEGGVPAGAKVTVIARVDGDEAFRGPAEVDSKGDCQARFKLPVAITRGEGTLAMVIEDGGVVETASKTIPILLQTVDLTMYPEGGELIAGLPNRVYFEAFTPALKPADLAGEVLDGEGNEVAEFRSGHEGRGRFELTPEKGESYTLKITEPSGINTQYPLPESKEAGVVLRADKDVFAGDEPVSVSLGSAAVEGELRVTISQREKQVAEATPKLGKADGLAQTKFELPDGIDGVLVATVWNADGQPLAERLIYRQPAKSIDVAIKADAEQYTPGGKAKITIETRDATGEPISAVVGVTVTDDSVLEMIEKRDQAPRLPVMVLLEGEVRELADAHVYLDAENEEAPRALDLLLGTQGWRRFAVVNMAKFIADNGDDARRVLALRMVSRVERTKLHARLGVVDFDDDGAVADDFLGKDEAKGDDIGAGQEKPQAASENAAAPARDNLPGDGRELNGKAEQAIGAPPAEKDREASASRPVPVELNKQRKELDQALDAVAKADVQDGLLRAGRQLAQQRNDFVAVRVYAHEVRSGRQPGERIDFTETLCWHAGIKTDEKGQATVEFALNDSVTSFRVFADAFAGNGALGAASLQIDSVEPFYLEPKLPLEVTSGDRIRLPIAVVNATSAPLPGVHFGASTHTSLDIVSAQRAFDLPADTRLRQIIDVLVGRHNGNADFTLTAGAGPYGDKVTRTLKVVPQGFPIEVGRGGLIGPGDTVSHEIVIPENLVPGSLTGRVVVYPTPLASMTGALERLIREPGGCFEQTSSTVYPLVMAQQYFMSHQGVDPALVERSSDILERGYQRLIGFECKSGGYEWFGADPGHDALTAYGLLEFTDMAQVRHVDPKMIERTRDWLLAQRDGKGGYARKTHTYHTWITDPECAASYNTWALLSAGIDADLTKEVEFVRNAGETSQNTYAVALAANVLSMAGDKEGEEHLLDKLAGKQTDDGSLQGATTSIVGSGGEALKIEATSLAVLAWLRNPSYAPQVEKSIKYLAENCKAGRFGSTQSTVLALQAIVAYDQSRAHPKAPGSLQLLVDGSEIGEPVAFTADTAGAIELPDVSKLLGPGKHQVQIKMTGGSQMPYSLAADYHSTKPASSEECSLHLQASLRDTKLDEGSVTEAEVVVVNRTNKDVPNPMAIVGIPGGLEVRHDQLKELVKAGKIAAYEVLGREVVLYWRAFQAEERVDLTISLVAAIPGSYTGPASRSYLYYTDEHKHWVDALSVEIAPK